MNNIVKEVNPAQVQIPAEVIAYCAIGTKMLPDAVIGTIRPMRLGDDKLKFQLGYVVREFGLLEVDNEFPDFRSMTEVEAAKSGVGKSDIRYYLCAILEYTHGTVIPLVKEAIDCARVVPPTTGNLETN